eukprot:TRINITY_DN3324_c0_g1_i1.p1 TRINITY_DN3324_c0_g1~~TRINITY_DN3324_c0_g1_i1.p1  ORF type:complete len:165 (+),score=31.42 TRINITY_DN3324_c0_g1_i1:452-946(+)
MREALLEHASHARNGAGTVLILGCGNSELSERMYDDGWTQQINIDFSKPVIDLMRSKHTDKPGMEWAVMDARDMSGVPDGSVQTVIDKGLIDALTHSDQYRDDIQKVVAESARVLRPGGSYICTSFKTPESLLPLLSNDAWQSEGVECRGNLTPTVLLYVGYKR